LPHSQRSTLVPSLLLLPVFDEAMHDVTVVTCRAP